MFFATPADMGPQALSARGSVWLERIVRDDEVAGSNPVGPTISENDRE